MPTTHFNPAHLTNHQLESLLELERELGTTVVALEPDQEVADLSAIEIERIRHAEANLGTVLVAYKRA